MEQRNCNIAFREMLGGASLIFLIAVGVSICTSSDAHAQAVGGGGIPLVDYVTTSDANSDGNLNSPAAAADYDVPADDGTIADPNPEMEPAASTDSVLELPQVVDPPSYAVASTTTLSPASADSNGALANAEAASANSDSALSDADDGGQPGSMANDAAADGLIGDVQDHQDQANGGPVVVYAAPMYVEPAPANFARMAGPTALALRAVTDDQQPIANFLRSQAGGRGRFQLGGGKRVCDSRQGRDFVMPHGPMAMSVRGRSR